MAYDFVSASSQYLSLGSAGINAFPLSMSIWFKDTSLTQNHTLMGPGAGTSGSFAIASAAGAISGDPLRAVVVDSGPAVGADARTGAAYSATAWNHGAVAFNDQDTGSAKLNGGTLATNDNPTKIDDSASWTEMYIGAAAEASPSTFADGLLAEAGIWSIELSDAEMLQLSFGLSPLMVRPDALVFYWSGMNGLLDEIGGTLLTNNAAATAVNDHPPMIYPGDPIYIQPADVAAAVALMRRRGR